MDIVSTEKVKTEIAFVVTDGDYTFMNTYFVDGTPPATEPPEDEKLRATWEEERSAWDKAREAEKAEQYSAWRVIMDTPAKEPTKEDHVAEVARAQRDIVDAQARLSKATLAIAAIEAVEVVEKPVVKGEVVVGDLKVDG